MINGEKSLLNSHNNPFFFVRLFDALISYLFMFRFVDVALAALEATVA